MPLVLCRPHTDTLGTRRGHVFLSFSTSSPEAFPQMAKIKWSLRCPFSAPPPAIYFLFFFLFTYSSIHLSIYLSIYFRCEIWPGIGEGNRFSCSSPPVSHEDRDISVPATLCGMNCVCMGGKGQAPLSRGALLWNWQSPHPFPGGLKREGRPATWTGVD